MLGHGGEPRCFDHKVYDGGRISKQDGCNLRSIYIVFRVALILLRENL